MVASGSSDGSIKIWRLNDGFLIRTIAAGFNVNKNLIIKFFKILIYIINLKF
jgi:WD40 repeat protein